MQKNKRMEILKQRRTIRKYQQKDISSDLLNDLLDSAFRASTVGNMQVYSVIVTRDAEFSQGRQVHVTGERDLNDFAYPDPASSPL